MPSAPTLPPAPDYTYPGIMWTYRFGGSWLIAYPGGASGRVVGSDGVARFVLGVEGLDTPVVTSQGDFVEIYQEMPLDDIDLVTFDLTAVVGAVAAGATWYAKVLVDDVLLATLELPHEATTDASEVAAPVRRYTGRHVVAIRLEVG